MDYGNKSINDLTQEEIKNILDEIIEDCIDHVGDSYSDFARPVISLLVRKELVSYREREEK